MDSKNFTLITQFYTYCAEHPEERFWQALRNWSGYNFILGSNEPPYVILPRINSEDLPLLEIIDTFYSDKRNEIQQ